VLPLQLRRAYEETAYIVQLHDGPLSIRIGKHHPELDCLLAAHQCQTWVFLSAENPRSEALLPELNERRHHKLIGALEKQRVLFFEGKGVPDRPGWQPEKSVLVLGADAAWILRHAVEFEQLAVVEGRIGEPARLSVIPLAQAG
jgi:hypothetical protein